MFQMDPSSRPTLWILPPPLGAFHSGHQRMCHLGALWTMPDTLQVVATSLPPPRSPSGHPSPSTALPILLLCDPSPVSQRLPRTTAPMSFPSHHHLTAGLHHPRNQLCCPSLKQLFAEVLPFLWLRHPRRRRANPALGQPSCQRRAYYV